MDITVSSPGSPGTSFTDNVKHKIVMLNDVLENNNNFNSLSELKNKLKDNGFNASYTRNILPFLQYCGIIKYEGLKQFENKKIFTNIGHTYVDVLKSIQIVENEPKSLEANNIKDILEHIQEIIYFQCLVIMMKTPECSYAIDFFDVLRFVEKYKHIDSTEYMLIQYEREQSPKKFWNNMEKIITSYRNGAQITVKTKTKNTTNGDAKSVNSFPYVEGNFIKAGIFFKGDGNKSYLKEERRSEVECAIKEITVIWQNLVK